MSLAFLNMQIVDILQRRPDMTLAMIHARITAMCPCILCVYSVNVYNVGLSA